MDTLLLRHGCMPVDKLIARYQDVDRFMPCCQSCPNYGKNYSCPPRDKDYNDLLRRYRFAHLLGIKIPLRPGCTRSEMLRRSDEVKKAADLFWQSMENPCAGLYISSGSCTLHTPCFRSLGKPCPTPHRSRYSIDSFSFDITQLAEKELGVPLDWGDPPRYLFHVSAFLSQNERLPIDGFLETLA